MFGLGVGEMLLIGVIALVFIGPKKLPDLARGLGRGLREFQKAKSDFQDTITQEVHREDLQKIADAQSPKKENTLTEVMPSSSPKKDPQT